MGSKARKKKRLNSATHQSKSHDGHANDDKTNMVGSNSSVQATHSGKVTSRQVVQRSICVK